MVTSADSIISTLLAHRMILDRGPQNKPTTNSSNTALVARAHEGCTNPNCKVKKRATHTTANCYWPGGGKEGQFPPNFGQRARANVAASSNEAVEHFVLSAHIPDTLGDSGVFLHDDTVSVGSIPAMAFISKGFQSFGKDTIPTFMDSGASDMMFVSRDSFVEYTATPPRTGDSAKAVDGDFQIIGEGKVIQRYLRLFTSGFASDPEKP
jgi:hypothetical protein